MQEANLDSKNSKKNKYEVSKKVLSSVGKVNAAYGLIKQGDRVLLGLSGGKDSIMLACILERMQKNAPFKFEFEAMTIHYGLNEDFKYLTDICNKQGIKHHIYHTSIAQTVNEKRREKSSYCSFCSRLRRGSLYSKALEMGFNKVAIAHHLDDAIESFFMNLTYNGALRSMPPIYKASNGLEVIRPMIFVREQQSIDFIKSQNLQVAPDCNCPAKQPSSDRPPIARANTKQWLSYMQERNPRFFNSLKKAYTNIHLKSFGDLRYLDAKQIAKDLEQDFY